jgi:hypothetical protein
LPLKLRVALKFYIETGDLYVASGIAGLSVGEFNELRKRVRILNVAWQTLC